MIRSIVYNKDKRVNSVNFFYNYKSEEIVNKYPAFCIYEAFANWADVNDITLPGIQCDIIHFYEELYDQDVYVITFGNGFAYKVTLGGSEVYDTREAGFEIWVDEVEGCYDVAIDEPLPSTVDEQYIEFMVNYWCNPRSQVEHFMESAQYNPVLRHDIIGRFGHVYEIYDIENDNTNLFEVAYNVWSGYWEIQYYMA